MFELLFPIFNEIIYRRYLVFWLKDLKDSVRFLLSGEKGKEECISRTQKTREQVRARGHLNTHTTLSPLHRGRQPALDDKESWYFWKTSLASFRSSS